MVQPKVKTRRPYLNLQSSQPSHGTVQASQQSQASAGETMVRAGGKKANFREQLRGPMYNEFLRYTPIPSYVRWPPVISPEEEIPTSPVRQKEANIFEDEEDLEEDEDFKQGDQPSQQPRRSVRLQTKHQFKFKNTPDTALVLDDDNEDNV